MAKVRLVNSTHPPPRSLSCKYLRSNVKHFLMAGQAPVGQSIIWRMQVRTPITQSRDWAQPKMVLECLAPATAQILASPAQLGAGILQISVGANGKPRRPPPKSCKTGFRNEPITFATEHGGQPCPLMAPSCYISSPYPPPLGIMSCPRSLSASELGNVHSTLSWPLESLQMSNGS